MPRASAKLVPGYHSKTFFATVDIFTWLIILQNCNTSLMLQERSRGQMKISTVAKKVFE